MQEEKQKYEIPINVTINEGVFKDGEIYDSLRQMFKDTDPDYDERAQQIIVTDKIYKDEKLHKDEL